MIEVKIPLKITLFGEHAVVYGEPAIAATISEKMKIRIIPNDKMILKSNSLSIKGIKVNLDEMKLESEETGKILSYILSTINYFKDEIGKQKNALIEIESPVEPSVGLGTSAAVVVGTVAGYSKLLGLDLEKEEIAKISYKIEKSVQGGLGSRMDTYTTALGGIMYFPPKEGYEKINKKLNITAGYIRRIATTAETLKRVKSIREKDEDLFNQIISTIGKIVEKAKKAIYQENEEELGELMYINHGLLMALGVTLPPIDNLVSTAKTLGILGCKISGGGGGGSIICTKDERAKILLSTIGAKIIDSDIIDDGVTITEIN